MSIILTVDEGISVLKRCKDDARCEFDFCCSIPTRLDSWRGDYSQLALGWVNPGRVGDDGPMLAAALLREFEDALGKQYTGWKGGEYVMHSDTPVWVDNPGCYTRTALVKIRDEGNGVVLCTDAMPFAL